MEHAAEIDSWFSGVRELRRLAPEYNPLKHLTTGLDVPASDVAGAGSETVVTVDTDDRVAAFAVQHSVDRNGVINFACPKLFAFLLDLPFDCHCNIGVAGSDTITGAFAHLVSHRCSLGQVSINETPVGLFYSFAESKSAGAILNGLNSFLGHDTFKATC